MLTGAVHMRNDSKNIGAGNERSRQDAVRRVDWLMTMHSDSRNSLVDCMESLKHVARIQLLYGCNEVS